MVGSICDLPSSSKLAHLLSSNSMSLYEIFIVVCSFSSVEDIKDKI